MKTIFLMGLFCSTVGFAATVSEFINSVSGNYTIAEDQNVKCPYKVQVFSRADVSDTLTLQSDKTQYPKYFEKINHPRQRYNDDFGTYNDYRATLKNNQIVSENRNCGGIVIVRCAPWSVFQKATFTKNTMVVEIPVNSGVGDSSGFPVGACLYLKK